MIFKVNHLKYIKITHLKNNQSYSLKKKIIKIALLKDTYKNFSLKNTFKYTLQK